MNPCIPCPSQDGSHNFTIDEEAQVADHQHGSQSETVFLSDTMMSNKIVRYRVSQKKKKSVMFNTCVQKTKSINWMNLHTE